MQATDRTVYVGNVGKEVDEAALLALFGHCGQVCRRLVARPPETGFCTVGGTLLFKWKSIFKFSHKSKWVACLAGYSDQNRWRPVLRDSLCFHRVHNY